MGLQRQIINHYFELFGEHRTLREISAHLNIQITKVFRILNGYEMKISEYEKFRQAMGKKAGEGTDLSNMAVKGEKTLSYRMTNDLKQILEMKIRLHNTVF